MNKKNSGFTLIELLVVISIIGILIALSVFGLQAARKSARDAQRKAALEEIRSGVEIYKADCSTYPASVVSGDPLVGSGASCSPSDSTYIDEVPSDPLPSQNYSYKLVGSKYYLCASLEQAPGGTPDANLANCNSCGATSCNYVVKSP